MPTMSRPLLTRPRKSQLILEGTTATVSTILILWLLLWFIHRGPNDLQIQAFTLTTSSRFVPFLEADARSLSRSDSVGRINQKTEMTGKISEIVGSIGAPAVISISAPVGIESDALNPYELVQQVAREAKRDVLLILDMSQIDSDRELGVFGNSPYRELFEKIEKEEEKPKNDKQVMVLCSATPGQKSWMIDELGRSAFSYFVQKGLMEGNAKPVERRGPLYVEELHKFVLGQTSQWVYNHRGRANQTPKLLAAGGQKRPFAIPLLKKQIAEPSSLVSIATKPEPEPSKTAEKPATTKPVVDEKSPQGLLAALIKEWETHEEFQDPQKAKLPPYHVAPAPWRSYESRLLLAERKIRAAQSDPNSLEDARNTLINAQAQGERVKKAIQQAKQTESKFPFQPVKGDEPAERILQASLIAVTRKGLNNLASPPPPPGVERAAGEAKLAVNQGAVELRVPTELEEAATIGRPDRYLELQLPSWAYRFQQAFSPEMFRDDLHGSLLRESILKRLPAESSLAVDRRGLDWIKKTIGEGDTIRRGVQDDLFALDLDGPSVDRLKKQTAEYGAKYEEASKRIALYHDARNLLERIAATFPSYAEWEVLDELRPLGGSEASKEVPTGKRKVVLQETKFLIDALEQPGESSALNERFNTARFAFSELEDAFRSRIDALRNSNEDHWRELDDILVSPNIRPVDRKALLSQILGIKTNPSGSRKVEAAGSLAQEKYAIDEGFRQKAFELARLDERIRSLASDLHSADEGLAKLEKFTEPETEPVPLLGAFSEFTRHTQKARRPSSPKPPEGAVTETGVAKILRAVDRDVRFRTASEIDQSQDLMSKASIDLEAFARQCAIRFHLERLVQDHARNIDFLNAKARDKNEFSFAGYKPDDIRILEGLISPEMSGASPFAIDNEKHSLILPVRLETSNVPNGRAFVGLIVPKPVADPPSAAGDTAEEAGRLAVALLPENGSDPRDLSRFAGGLLTLNDPSGKPLRFLVKQLTDAIRDQTLKSLNVKVFYRGRFEDEQDSVKVAVACRKFAEPIVIKIEQDRNALSRIYTEEVAKQIPDPFVDFPRNGYLHEKGKIHFILNFRNASLEQRTIVISRTLAPADSAEGESVELKPETRDLKPGESFPLPQVLTAQQVPIGSPKLLKVVVRDPNKKILTSTDYTFKQLPLSTYMKFGTKPDFFRKEGKQVYGLIIDVTHEADDPVTVPILFKEMRFSVNNKEPENGLSDTGYLLRGKNVLVTYEILPGVKDISWTAEIEGTKKNETFKVP